MTEPVPEDDLTTVAGRLVGEVQALTRKFRLLRHLAIGLAVSVLLDITLTIVLATVLSGQADQNHKIKQALSQNYVTAQQQQQTRTQVLCPLYQLFVSLAQAPDRTQGMTPAQKLRSDQAAAAILDQYHKLKCPS